MIRVDAAETSKLGWSRDTYTNTYAPQFPMQAILANHGFKAYEQYDPSWRHVPVPAAFLSRVCPMAEGILALLKESGKEGLVGATKHWEMVISLRPYLFQVCNVSNLI